MAILVVWMMVVAVTIAIDWNSFVFISQLMHCTVSGHSFAVVMVGNFTLFFMLHIVFRQQSPLSGLIPAIDRQNRQMQANGPFVDAQIKRFCVSLSVCVLELC